LGELAKRSSETTKKVEQTAKKMFQKQYWSITLNKLPHIRFTHMHDIINWVAKFTKNQKNAKAMVESLTYLTPEQMKAIVGESKGLKLEF